MKKLKVEVKFTLQEAIDSIPSNITSPKFIYKHRHGYVVENNLRKGIMEIAVYPNPDLNITLDTTGLDVGVPLFIVKDLIVNDILVNDKLLRFTSCVPSP